MRPEAERLEALAQRLRAVEPVAPSPAAKIRGWNIVLAAVQQSATSRSPVRPLRRLLLAPVVIVLLLLGGLAASADSLPDSPLYPLRRVVESARGTLAFSPSDQLAYHLSLADSRLADAEAMVARHRVDLAKPALSALADQLQAAAVLVSGQRRVDPTAAADMADRLRQAAASQDRQLAGLEAQVKDPGAVKAISAARARAAETVQVLASPSSSPSASPSASNSPTPSPSEQGSPSASGSP